jgi:hypothetical protein
MPRSYKVGYREQLEQFQENRFTVNPDTSIDAFQQYTEEDMTIRAIGSFHVPAGVLESQTGLLFAAVEKGRLIEMEDIETDLGMLYVRKTLVVAEGDQVRMFEFALGDDVPTRLALAFERAKELEEMIRGFPKATLRVEYSYSPATFVSGQEARFRFRYCNDGGASAELLNPRLFQEFERNHFELTLWKQEEDEEGVSQEKVATIDLARLEHRTGERTAIPSDQQWLTLAPGERLDFSVAFPFPTLPAGEYLLDLAYEGMPQGDPQENQISGEYHADLATIQVQAR